MNQKNKKLYEIIINNKPNSPTINSSDDAYIYIPETTIPTTIIMEEIKNNYSTNYTWLLENIKNNGELYSLIVNDILKAYSNNEDQIIEGKDGIIYQITNNKNQIKILSNKTFINNNKNLSIINLTNCEDILKKEYNINPNDSLIILKQENISTNLKSSEKNVQYDVFEPYNKTKLNLSLCEETTINLYTKIIFSEKNILYEKLKELGYDMLNINDKFYQDICSPYKTEHSTDILLTDRIDYVYNNDDAQCQTNCQFSEYLLDTQYISCECSLDGKNLKNRKEKFNTKKIYESFYEVLKYSNYKVFKCYNLVFSNKIFSENIGGIIIFSYFCVNFGCFVCFLVKKDNSLKNEILNPNKANNKKQNKIKKKIILLLLKMKST